MDFHNFAKDFHDQIKQQQLELHFVPTHDLGEPLVEGEFDDEKELLKVNPPVLAASNAITAEQMYRETILSKDPLAIQSSLQQKFIRPLSVKELYDENADAPLTTRLMNRILCLENALVSLGALGEGCL